MIRRLIMSNFSMDSNDLLTATDPAAEIEITEEGKVATVLDPELESKLQNAKQLVNEGSYNEASDILSFLLQAAVAKYGQLAPVVAPIYFAYGDVLLSIIEVSDDALGSSANDAVDAEAAAITAEEEEEEEEEVKASGNDGNDASESKVDEEDITADNQSETPDDREIAWECLDVARVIFSKMDSEEAQLKTIDVIIRLGDCNMESDKFDDALSEYENALTLLNTKFPNNYRDIAYCLFKIVIAFVEKSSANNEISEEDRRQFLSNASEFACAASEALVSAILKYNVGNETFNKKFQAELNANALTKVYPSGVSLTAVDVSNSSLAQGDSEVRVFRTVFESSFSDADLSNSDVMTIRDLVEFLDSVIQKRSDIDADIAVNMTEIKNMVGEQNGSTVTKDGGVTTTGFAAPTFSSSSAAAGTPVMLVGKRKRPEVEEPSSNIAA